MDAPGGPMQPEAMRGLGLLGSVALLASACGPRLMTDEGVGASGSTSGDASDDSGDGDSATHDDAGVDGVDPATGDDGEPDTGGSDGADTGEPGVLGTCDVLEGEVLAVTIDESTARIVRGDTSTVVIDIAPVEAPRGAHLNYGATASADAVAIVTSWTLAQSGITHGFTLRVFDADGDLLWQRRETGASLGTVGIGRDASVVATRYLDSDQTEGVLYTGQDTTLGLGEFTPIGTLREDGLIAGRVAQPDGLGALGWFDTHAAAFVPTALVATGYWVEEREGILLYQSDGVLAVEAPGALSTVALGDHANSFVVSSSEDWLLLRDSEATQWARVSLDTMSLDALTLQPPAEFSFMECYSLVATIDRGGDLYIGTRDALAAQAQRHSPASQTWVAVGEPVTRVDNLEAVAVGDTVIVRSDGEHTTFCPPQEFDPAIGVLQGQQWQVVRPDEGLQYLLPPDAGWVAANEAGTCVRYGGPSGSVVLDTRSGEELALAGIIYLLR